MDENRTPFEPKTTGKSSLRLRLTHAFRVPKYKTMPAIVCSVISYLVVYNSGVWYWKGGEHPINRFNWQLKKSNGQLSSEMLEKERIILEYYKSRLFNANDTPPTFTY